jgi:HK97 family phage portal protein
MDYGPLSDFWYNPVGTPSSAGVAVKPDNAMAVSAVFGCIRLLSEIIGGLNFRVCQYQIRNGRIYPTDAPEHELYDVLYRAPNRWQTALEWGEMGVAHIALRGNFYSRIILNEEGRVELVPLNPDRVMPEQLANRMIRYVYRPKVGQSEILGPGEVLHVRGLSLDGVLGVSVLEFARNSVGTEIAQETHGASLFKNGGLPTFWISRPREAKFTPDARRNFRSGWRKLHGGAENAGNPPILEDGMELHELGLSNRDSQWLESRAFQGEDICRFFRVPSRMLGFKSADPKANVEQESIEFVRYTLKPWANRWQQALGRDLIVDPEKHCVDIDLDELEQGDKLSRYTANNIAIQGGWKLVNEIRAVEGDDPIEGGDKPRFPMNMQPAGGGPDQNEQGGQPGKGSPKPKQQPADQADDGEEDPTAYEKRQKAKKQKKKQKAAAAFAPLLEDAAARIAATEIRGLARRADKAGEDRKRWNEWAAEVYEGVAACTTKILGPIGTAWLAATGESIDVAPMAAAIVREADPIFDAADVATVLARWETTRSAEVLGILRKGFFNEPE